MTNLTGDNLKWNFKKKFGFKFVFFYFLLFITIDGISRLGILFNSTIKIFDDVFTWVGHYILNIPYHFFFRTNGSGDTTYHFVALFCVFVIAILGDIVWTLFDRKIKNYKLLYYWFTVVLRFYLGFILINYGLVKLFYLQFPEPSLYRLVETYGNSSPMGLAWTFLGYSKGYNLFMGIAEIMSVFLFFRRTLVFGLIITFIITLNVTAINFFYDIPLKIIAAHLTLITILLLSHDFKKIWNFFFTNREVSLSQIERPKFLNKPNFNKLIIILKSIMLVAIFALAGFKLDRRNEIFNGEFSKSEFYGIYDVISYKINGDCIPLDENYGKRWRYLIMQYEGRVQLIDNKRNSIFYSSKIYANEQTIKLFRPKVNTDVLDLKYKKLENRKIVFKSRKNGDSIEVICRILKKSDFLLINRKFNWINETPFNK